VAPWHSVYKLNLLTDTDVTFLLTNGGHNAGVVSEPGTPGRHYRVSTKLEHDRYVYPEAWIQEATQHEESWWMEWARWLALDRGILFPPAYRGGDLGTLQVVTFCKRDALAAPLI
jgi:polyhydroxyalkanoate synthase subunit PhaC